MNALYAVVFSACWIASYGQEVEPTVLSSISTANVASETAPVVEVSSANSNIYSRPTTSDTASKPSIIISTAAFSVTPANEPATQSNPLGETSHVPLAATVMPSLPPASSERNPQLTTTDTNTQPPPQPATLGTTSQPTTTSTTSRPVAPSTAVHTTKKPVVTNIPTVTTSTKSPQMSTALPIDKSSASLMKTSISLIFIPALSYLLFEYVFNILKR